MSYNFIKGLIGLNCCPYQKFNIRKSSYMLRCPTLKGAVLASLDCTRFICLGFSVNVRSLYNLFIYFGFYVTFNTVQVISRRVVGRAEETSTYSWSRFCTVNCRPTASNYQLSHLRLCCESNPSLRGGRRECYHFVTVVPQEPLQIQCFYLTYI